MQGLPSYSNHIFVITSQDMLPRFYIIFTEGAQIMFWCFPSHTNLHHIPLILNCFDVLRFIVMTYGNIHIIFEHPSYIVNICMTTVENCCIIVREEKNCWLRNIYFLGDEVNQGCSCKHTTALRVRGYLINWVSTHFCHSCHYQFKIQPYVSTLQ